MNRVIKRVIAGILWALLVPYIMTLAWTGTVEGKSTKVELSSGKRILLDTQNTKSYLDVEEYLVGVVGKQIPADYEPETLKAQAIIARTYIYREMGDSMEIAESSLDLDYLGEKQLMSLWGEDKFQEYYMKMEQAVAATTGMVLTYEDSLIDPLFHRVSAGTTRNGDENHPYLAETVCPDDANADNYLSVLTFSKDEFAKRISQITDSPGVGPQEVPETIQLIEKEDSGYIKKIQIGSKTYTGEEVQYALGLSSPCFILEGYEDKIRAISQGIGHGYGMSQYEANVKAKEGWKAEDILNYFYKNIVIISE